MRMRRFLVIAIWAIVSYALHFPLRLFEDYVMGEMEQEIAKNWQSVLGFSITWIAPFVLVAVAMYLGYWLRKPKTVEKSVGGIIKIQQGLSSVVLYRHEWWLQTTGGERNFWDNEDDGIGLLLIGEIAININDQTQVESVELDMGGQTFKSNWQSQGFYISEEREVKFYIPFNTPRGRRTARIRAIANGQPYFTNPIILDIPKGKQVFGR